MHASGTRRVAHRSARAAPEPTIEKHTGRYPGASSRRARSPRAVAGGPRSGFAQEAVAVLGVCDAGVGCEALDRRAGSGGRDGVAFAFVECDGFA